MFLPSFVKIGKCVCNIDTYLINNAPKKAMFLENAVEDQKLISTLAENK
jgi:hypothetical protein